MSNDVFVKFSRKDIELIEQAREYALMAHEGQTRKDGKTPYIVHPDFVATLVRAHVSPAAIAAALLHDVVEDTKYEISMFPARVRFIVDLLTKRKDEGKFEAVQRLGDSMDTEAILIKVADRFHNLADGGKDFGKRWLEKYLMGAKHIYQIAAENGLESHELVQILKSRILELSEGADESI